MIIRVPAVIGVEHAKQASGRKVIALHKVLDERVKLDHGHADVELVALFDRVAEVLPLFAADDAVDHKGWR